MLQKAFPNAFANHGCILQHFEGFFKTPFRSTGHQSYSLDCSRIPRGQKDDPLHHTMSHMCIISLQYHYYLKQSKSIVVGSDSDD